jgi:hypothetical protein
VREEKLLLSCSSLAVGTSINISTGSYREGVHTQYAVLLLPLLLLLLLLLLPRGNTNN